MTRIAVVNDDTVFLDMMAAVLEERGWHADIYRESQNAFEKLKESRPDVIVLDIRMGSPETGWSLLELLTLDREMRRIPVIVCSAALLDLRAHEDTLGQYGIAILPKPFDIDNLYQHVEEALARSRERA